MDGASKTLLFAAATLTSVLIPSQANPVSGQKEDYRCRGIDCVTWDRTVQKVHEASEKALGTPHVEGGGLGCLWYTEEQIDRVLDNLKEDEMLEELPTKTILSILKHLAYNSGKLSGRRRKKRKVDYEIKFYKWKTGIPYSFDGSHDEEEEKVIRDAIDHWEKKTCIRFHERKEDIRSGLSEVSHITFTKEAEHNGCYSFVGRVSNGSQIINLDSNCLKQLGIPIHEIGHALGLWHEQQRTDRDDFIKLTNINESRFSSQFLEAPTKNNLPYDYTSVMHYPWLVGDRNSHTTITALKGDVFRRSMGQRVGMSFLDTKAINAEYCADKCEARHEAEQCQRGGYQDPNNCDRCVCPDGFGGYFCQTVAPSSEDLCGGTIQLAVGKAAEISSPGYDHPEYYIHGTVCNWIIEAPVKHRVLLRFEEEFDLLCTPDKVCAHWVEVKNGSDWDRPGPRFCCAGRPYPTQLESETSEMIVIMKSDVTTDVNNRGFKATLTAIPEEDRPWSRWTPCGGRRFGCQCGGGVTSFRRKMCGVKPCTGAYARVDERVCDRVCTSQDMFIRFLGSGYTRHSCPECYSGFSRIGDYCEKNTQ